MFIWKTKKKSPDFAHEQPSTREVEGKTERDTWNRSQVKILHNHGTLYASRFLGGTHTRRYLKSKVFFILINIGPESRSGCPLRDTFSHIRTTMIHTSARSSPNAYVNNNFFFRKKDNSSFPFLLIIPFPIFQILIETQNTYTIHKSCAFSNAHKICFKPNLVNDTLYMRSHIVWMTPHHELHTNTQNVEMCVHPWKKILLWNIYVKVYQDKNNNAHPYYWECIPPTSMHRK